MDIAKLTPEERNALTALVQSPGWALLMEKLFIPQVQLATQFLDRPQAEQSGRADWLRGVKAGYKNLVEVVYRVAGRENPFERHALGLLTTVQQSHIGETTSSNGSQKVEETSQRTEEREHRARSSFPV